MGPFFKIILYAVLIFYIFNMMIKLIFRRKIRKLGETMEHAFQEEIEPQTNEQQKPHIDPKIGEFTDFEEVE